MASSKSKTSPRIAVTGIMGADSQITDPNTPMNLTAEELATYEPLGLVREPTADELKLYWPDGQNAAPVVAPADVAPVVPD